MQATTKMHPHPLWTMAPEYDQVRHVFREWDTGGTGLIRRAQLVKVIARLNPNLSDSDVEGLFDEFGEEGKSDIPYDRFLTWLWGDEEEEETEFSWEGSLDAAKEKAARAFPPDRVELYFDEIKKRLGGQEYADHIKGSFFSSVDIDGDGRIAFQEAASLIKKSLRCVADLRGGPAPSKEDIRAAFDAHRRLSDTTTGRLGAEEFLNLTRYLQVQVAEAMLPLSQVVVGGG